MECLPESNSTSFIISAKVRSGHSLACPMILNSIGYLFLKARSSIIFLSDEVLDEQGDDGSHVCGA